jgi:hypothetical protein
MIVKIEDQILSEVWTRDGNRGGLQIPPIHIDLKTPGETIQRKQYHIPLERRLGLKPITKGLLKNGLLEPCMSPFNTLILPVRKLDGSYLLVQDLWPLTRQFSASTQSSQTPILSSVKYLQITNDLVL